MPKYEVDVTRTLTLAALVEVRAKDEDETMTKAETLAMQADIVWTIKDKLAWAEDNDVVMIDSTTELKDK